MTTREWKALERMVKGQSPLILHIKEGKVTLEYIPLGTIETYHLTLPYGTTTLYETSELPSRIRTYLREMYDVWYEWARMTL